MKNLYVRISQKNKDIEKYLEKTLKRLHIYNYEKRIVTDSSETYVIKTNVSKPHIKCYLDLLLSKRKAEYLTDTNMESNLIQILSFDQYYKTSKNQKYEQNTNYMRIAVPEKIIKQFKLYINQNHVKYLNSVTNSRQFYFPNEELDKLRNWKIWEEILEKWNIKSKEDKLEFI